MKSLLVLLLSTFALVANYPKAGFDKSVSLHFDRINRKYQRTGKVTATERLQCQMLYNSIATAGKAVSPEGAAVISHYINGDGSDLQLSESYLKTSPVIRRAVKSMRVGETRRVTFKQKEDWRLSYAFNPMHIKKEKHRITVYEYITFKQDKNTYTNLNYGAGVVKLPDGLIHVLKPKPYRAYATWTY